MAVHKLTTGESKSSRFTIESVFDETCDNEMLVSCLVGAGDPNTAFEWFCQGFNTAVIAYGEHDTGKSCSLLEGEKSGFTAVNEAVWRKVVETGMKVTLGLSVWEVTYENSAEKLIDLVKYSSKDSEELTTVEVSSQAEAQFVFDAARERSKSWRAVKARYTALPNKSHFFVRFLMMEGSQRRLSALHLVDLAGEPPAVLSEDYRAKIGAEELINYIKAGLHQFRALINELARAHQTGQPADFDIILGSRRLKLTQLLAPLLAGNNRTYLLGTVKNEGAYKANCRTLELLQRAQSVSVPCTVVNDSASVLFHAFEIFKQ
jgi:hypothetical protein